MTISFDEKKYLKKCKVTENDPGIFIAWDMNVLTLFVNEVNQLTQTHVEPQAHFITTDPGQMSVNSLINDIMTFLSKVAGGR